MTRVVRRMPIDPRLPALGLITASLSPPTGRPMDPLAFATGDLLADAEPHALILGLVKVAAQLARDHALCCAVGPLAVVRALALEIQSEECIAVRPWMRLAYDQPDEQPPAPPTTNPKESHVALLNRKPPPPPDVETDAAGNTVAVPISGSLTEALQAGFKDRPSVRVDTHRVVDGDEPTTPEQARADRTVRSLGLEYDSDTNTVRLPAPEPERDEPLFRQPLEEWTTAAGDRSLGLQFAQAGRFQRAAALARLGRLTNREVEHLQWLASTDTGFESVAEGTDPLSPEQAAKVVAVVERTSQKGRPFARDGQRPGTVDLSDLVEER